MAQHEPSHQDLHCLQISYFLSLVLKELSSTTRKIRHSLKPGMEGAEMEWTDDNWLQFVLGLGLLLLIDFPLKK